MKLTPLKNKKISHYRNELENFFDDFLTPSTWPNVFNKPGKPTFSFDMDISESDSGYHIDAEIPGMEEKDIEVSVEGSHLLIKGEKKEESTKKEKNYYSSERSYGSFMRSVALPDNIDDSKIEAGYKNGVLNVFIPKAANSPKRKVISVKKK